MALDIYVGTLTRYYTRTWATLAQVWAEEQGVAYHIVRPTPEDSSDQPADAETAASAEVKALILDWRAALGRQLAGALDQPLDWDESDTAPYFTNRPAWDGYGSLLLLAAYDEHPDLEPPKIASQLWDEDPAWQRSSADRFHHSRYRHLLGAEMWLPCPIDPVVDFPSPTGRHPWIGSTIYLLAELRSLCDRTPPRVESAGLAQPGDDEPEYTFADAAWFGLSMFLDLAEKSVSYRLPMTLDF